MRFSGLASAISLSICSVRTFSQAFSAAKADGDRTLAKAMMMVVVFSIVLPCFSESSIWSGEVSIEQPLLSSQSVDEAKAIALRRLQLDAASQAGAYIVRTEKIIDGQYFEDLQVVSAAIVKLDNVRSVVSAENGLVVLDLSATAQVDLDTVKDKVAYLRENAELRELVSEMNKEYLASLNKGLPIRTDLVWHEQNWVKRWVSLSELDSMVTYHKLRQMEMEHRVNKDLILPFLDQSELMAKVESVVERDEHYEFKIRVNFDFSEDRLIEAGSEYWEIHSASARHDYVVVNGTRPKQTDSMLGAVFDELFSGEVIAVEVAIGDRTKRLPVGYPIDGFMPSCMTGTPTDKSRVYCLSKIDANSSNKFNAHYYENPVRLRVPKAELNPNGVTVEAKLISVSLEDFSGSR